MTRHSSMPDQFFLIVLINFLLFPISVRDCPFFNSNISKAARKAQNRIKFVHFCRLSMGKKENNRY